jgi:hypothetical protein
MGLLFLSSFAKTVLISSSSVREQKKVFVMDPGTYSSSAVETDYGKTLRSHATRDTGLMSGPAAPLWLAPAALELAANAVNPADAP